jgi:hypothetical protein
MNLVDWVLERRLGVIEEFDDYVEIHHENGQHSLIWMNKKNLRTAFGGEVDEFYRNYDVVMSSRESQEIISNDSNERG